MLDYKIAIILYGHLRTFSRCAPSLRKHIRNPLKADLFLHTWNEFDSTTPAWYSENWKVHNDNTNISACVEKAYNPTGFQIDTPITREEIKNEFLYDQNNKPRISLMGLYSGMTSLKRAVELLSKYEKKEKIKYKYIIVTRPDIYFGLSTTLFFEKNITSLDKSIIGCNALSVDNFKIGDCLINRKTGFDTAFWGSKEAIIKFSRIVDYFDNIFSVKKTWMKFFHKIGVFWPEVFYELYLNLESIHLQCFDLDVFVERKKGVEKKSVSFASKLLQSIFLGQKK